MAKRNDVQASNVYLAEVKAMGDYSEAERLLPFRYFGLYSSKLVE